jgi:uncharacterized protein
MEDETVVAAFARDAVHLASALAVDDPDLILAVWDRRLHDGAATAGLPAAPAHLPAT